MKLVFPTNKNDGYLSKRGAHFGKANYYTIITLKKDKIVDVESVKNPGHSEDGCGNAVTNILNLEPNALIVSGIGGPPARGFAKAGLDLYFDTVSSTVQDSVKLFLEGKLQKSTGEGTCSTH